MDANRRSFLTAAAMAAASTIVSSRAPAATRFKRIPTQFIAALGEPKSRSGDNAHLWGLWRLDPGPRGVWLDDYKKLAATGGTAPARWQFDRADWWLEEHGLIMEAPQFPLAAGHYRVTGNRWVTTTLTVQQPDDSGHQAWKLDDGATLHDVTHLACRSARYTPTSSATECTPASATMKDFPVRPGAAMPAVENCSKQDYAVLLVTGLPA